MAFNSIPTTRPKPDLRSSTSIIFRKGITIGSVRVATFVLLDAVSIYLSWQLALSHGTQFESPWTTTQSSLFLPIIIAVGIGVIDARGLYKSGKYHRDYVELVKAVSLVNLFLLLIAFLYNPSRYISRSAFLLFWFLSVTSVCTCRVAIAYFVNLLRQRGIVRYPVFLIADKSHQEKNVQLIEHENCYSILGIADSSSLDRRNREATFESLQKLGVAEVFASWSSIKNRLYLCWHFQTIGITLRILPMEPTFSLPRSGFESIGNIPSPVIRAPIIIGGDYWVKRGFDFCFSTLLLLFFSPLYFLIALLIKIDSPGPIFFRQTRVGLHGRYFKVWKFRTMVANADRLQATLEARNEMKDGVLFKMKDDPRITRIGKFLRRYSLDELPQLFNVLVGEMSIVEPRPLPVRDVQRFEERHFIRQEVLPGITGLWQVSGRSDINNFDDTVNLDIVYICSWSLQLDMKIILQTVGVVLQKKGAY